MWVYTALFSEMFTMRNNPGSCKTLISLGNEVLSSGTALLLPPASTLPRKWEAGLGDPQLQNQSGGQTCWMSLDLHLESCSKLPLCSQKKDLFFGCFQEKMSINTTVTLKGFPENWQWWEHLQHGNWQVLPGSPPPPQFQPVSTLHQYTIT